MWTLGLAGALLLGAGCKQGLGERCQISDDCSGDLVCSIATKTCETSQNGPTTDGAYYWAREMTPAMAQANSPHRFVGNITTPMLVIHGDKDYRVPIGEALRLWYELLTESGLPGAADGTAAHRFLYFPSENHWVLSPQHAKIWYQVVASFLGVHVLGLDEDLPEALG